MEDYVYGKKQPLYIITICNTMEDLVYSKKTITVYHYYDTIEA